jgi:hypothetical protein
MYSMWWRSCSGDFHHLQLDETLNFCGLMSNRRELTMNPRAGGVVDLGTQVVPAV